MNCAHPECQRLADARISRFGHGPRYCREHRERRWVIWRHTNNPAPPRPKKSDFRDRSPARDHAEILADLGEQIAGLLRKWERRFAESKDAP